MGSATTIVLGVPPASTSVARTRSREPSPSRDPGTVTGLSRARATSSGRRIEVRRSALTDALTTRP